ncbi:MAG: hypothetical protein ACLUIW_08735 [Dysosmobacter welbionis]
MVEEDTSEERVLAEIPELAITETDRKILSALEASPSVQAAVAGGEQFIDLPPSEHEDIHAILSEFLDEERYQFSDAGVTAQSGEVASLYYDIFDREEGMHGSSYRKAEYRGPSTRQSPFTSGDPEEKLSVVIYENDERNALQNEEVTACGLWLYETS